jgi:hypothetical protein
MMHARHTDRAAAFDDLLLGIVGRLALTKSAGDHIADEDIPFLDAELVDETEPAPLAEPKAARWVPLSIAATLVGMFAFALGHGVSPGVQTATVLHTIADPQFEMVERPRVVVPPALRAPARVMVDPVIAPDVNAVAADVATVVKAPKVSRPSAKKRSKKAKVSPPAAKTSDPFAKVAFEDL